MTTTTEPKTSSIPDDGSMEAALYGTAHIETIINRENAAHVKKIYTERVRSTLADLDPEVAEWIMLQTPFLVYSEDDIGPEWPDDIKQTAMKLRYIVRQILAFELVTSWADAADHRGRLIGLGEHSARITVSGSSDKDFKIASMRFKEGTQ